MKFSLSYLGTNIEQLPEREIVTNNGVESALFNREDLEETPWKLVWDNIAIACERYGSENVSFHFPVNDSDFVADSFVRKRLTDALQRASDYGLRGVVVHSNRISSFDEWRTRNLAVERRSVVETLCAVREEVHSPTWLGLENMPVMGNFGKEIDPIFVYPDDFQILVGTDVGIVWDICHSFGTIAQIEEVTLGKQAEYCYPSIRQMDFLEFTRLSDQIVHWHFSSFVGTANPETGSICREGVLPSEGSVSESKYRRAFIEMEKVDPSRYVNFEVKESDYLNRQNGKAIIEWSREVLQQKNG